ncbi:dnaJ -like protein [Brachionus plicatilis]|uniref:DnaJ homolog subfamily C member 22 n=1 Tax=Brachionus plicatilis TaxID=10195 RepID=A0A3M7SU02_BRAPC|nr:dnaJ -like protein [Brachionus plicatilis]
MTKSIKTAYVIWLFGGLFGLHHFYLKRDKQGFIYMITLGGFLIAFLRDVYRLPEYVREANEDKIFMEKLRLQQDQLKTPLFMTSRFISSIAVGSLFGYLAMNCLSISGNELSYHWSEILVKFLSPIIVACVVYLIGTEGPIRCSFEWPLLGSYISLFFDSIKQSTSIFNASIFAALLLNWNLKWDNDYFERVNKRKLITRIFHLGLGFAIFSGLLGLFIWNNATLEYKGEKVTISEYFEKLYNTEEMKKAREVLKMLWDFYQAHGLRRLINHFYYGYDPEAIAHAYKILELNERSTQQDIDQRCRMLSRKWHPDKYKDMEKKINAEKIFMDVQQSCNILSEHRRNRIDQNKKSEM